MRDDTYGLLDRWLHWLALEPASVRRLSFELECQFSLPQRKDTATAWPPGVPDPAAGAVYVCGLARSGTTMLLRILDELDVFRSLTYRDMPFVLAPNLWQRITRLASRHSIAAERAHGDGIMVDFDSPEGFEEVFWRTFGTSTADPRCLGADEPTAEVLDTFAAYRALVANPRTDPPTANSMRKRYLSKNNNNLVRLRSLCADTTATVLLVYRNPVATARSLHRQHLRFCAVQNESPFRRTYMAWLAHHEFGLDHHPFCFAVPDMDASRIPDDPNYWLDYWNAVYRHVLTQSHLRFHLINHDTFRAYPSQMVEAICTALGVSADTALLAQQITAPDSASSDGFSADLLRRADTTYHALVDSSKNLLATARFTASQ